uniref:Dihydropteroate synthase (FolP) n=1 Tax=uncultured marine thaumarchaeote AD1000_40_H03 TaxID=1455914 RepID=A0A075FWH7_9ARCH|nr:dihydropteroate synthase (folP) [uncultured marine thaumarchaeote AD1000_40_H03]
MEDEGADIIDIGGMSTAPYLKTTISEKQESIRISKAIKIIQNITNLPISIDTCRATVAESSLELGVEIINDVSGLKFDQNMPKILERFQPSLILCAYSKKL